MINVIKANGEREAFDEEKIMLSIKRAGIPNNIQDKVLQHVKDKLHEDISTTEIYKHLTEYLGQQGNVAKARYSLKHAIMALGPTGYPFEDYVSDILKEKGYTTQVRSILTGQCVSHEIDVIAEKKGVEKIMVEAKFHNDSGTRTDVHVSLYTKARFEDLKDKYNFDKAYIYTNTKITPDALTYALCSGMGVVSWSYPEEESLRDLVHQYRLYPLTILPSLSSMQIQALLENHLVLVRDICQNKDSLDVLGLPKEKSELILNEAKSVCDV